MLRLKQRIQLRLLRRTGLQLQHHPVQRRLRAYHANVKLSPRQRMHIPQQRDHPRLVNGSNDPVRPHHPVYRRLTHGNRDPSAHNQSLHKD